MSHSGPQFLAWCDEPKRIDALAAALSALVIPGNPMSVNLSADDWCETSCMEQALAMVRAHFGGRNSAHILSGVRLNDSERVMLFSLACYPEESERRHPYGPLRLDAGERKRDFYPYEILVGGNGPRSVEAEAAVAGRLVQSDVEELLLRLCAPDTSGRVPTGACTDKEDWIAPVEMCATYNANAMELARDLALSWVSLHHEESVSRIAGMSLAALRARVDAAPCGARVPMKGGNEVTRSLSRETVLKALATSPATLLEALEASAFPDDEWIAAEARARVIMEATKEGGPTYQANIAGKHARFIARHAPFHVRRVPSGGVMLATHPYRTLWPLWADALFLLGLMS